MALEVVKPKICWGVKVKGSRRLKCGEPVDDPRVIKEVMKLINEFLNRVERHKSLLLSDSATPFDESIRALNNWLTNAVAMVNDNEVIAELMPAEQKTSNEMIELLSQVRKKWLSAYKPELRELIEKLRKGEAEIIINGEPFNSNKSFIAYLYTENLAIEVDKVAKSESITMIISLTGLSGVYVTTPRLFSENKLRAMQYGLLLTDGAIHEEGYPEMNTNRLWQAIVFTLIFPGRTYMNINGININNDDISIKWNLKAMDYKDKFEDKTIIAEEASKLSNEEFLPFILFLILGDGYVTNKNAIGLTLGNSKHELWSGIIKRLENLRFRMYDEKHKIVYMVMSSKAIELAKKMLSDPTIKALIENLSKLPDADKLRRLIRLINITIKPRDRSSVEIAGIKMSVFVNDDGFVELKVGRKEYEEARTILERLKGAGYEEVELSKWIDRYVVYMGMNAIRKYPELVAKVCEILKRMLEEAINEGNERRAKKITKAMTNLNCPPAQIC